MLNHCTFIGNLVRDPELRATQNGTSVCNFTIAAEDGWGDKKHTEFVNCVAWSKNAENLNSYQHKGNRLYVQGRMHTRTWDNKEGVKQYKTEVVADVIKFLDKKEDNRVPNDDNQPF